MFEENNTKILINEPGNQNEEEIRKSVGGEREGDSNACDTTRSTVLGIIK